MKFSAEHIKKGTAFFSTNPQILYTTFLLIVIPTAFLFSAQTFLDVARGQQDQLEQNRISLMLDTFSKFASPLLSDGYVLQSKVVAIAKQNDTITAFEVLRRSVEEGSNVYSVVASMDETNIGKQEQDPGYVAYYDQVREENPYIQIVPQADGRHWVVAYPLLDENRNVSGIVLLDVSMAGQDSVFAANIQRAYIILIGVILLVAVLLIRQARVIDYAVLYKRLKEVDQMKDDFVSMAAHELRTPLTIIRGYTEMLSGSKRLGDTDRQMTTNIQNSANHLNQLIGDILDVSRLQQGRLSFDLKVIQPTGLINDVVESLKYTANQKGLQLSYEAKEATQIEVDADRLKQILINIVGNAVKYTLTGSVTVTSYVDKDRYYIRVSDTGIGISAEGQKKLFTRFYRVRTKETEDIRGTGLGLWITKEIVTQMKGTISVESIQGKGTDFIVVFPVVKTVADQA
jgi:signal transduction histidine kinase